jgi:hypothetical protein
VTIRKNFVHTKRTPTQKTAKIPKQNQTAAPQKDATHKFSLQKLKANTKNSRNHKASHQNLKN